MINSETIKNRIDIISIFPEYLAPLELSLIGKAREAELLEIVVTDLRDFTADIHRTVDDTPYGGGAGMVMMPTIWGEAIDHIAANSEAQIHDLVILTPAGELFTQAKAQEMSTCAQVIFACGRYEGIDQRVTDHYRSRSEFRVHEVSIGDYVLNGGEAAALVMIEAIVRLIPGVIGNPASLEEESHTIAQDDLPEALLEYPTYTKPPLWRELAVPEVLTSGNHGLIQKWRREMALARTRRVRGLTRE
ncbi:MAG: tRNA (guanosine(37)-N1)-methyltransferase TrmD [Actinomycetes bacterium]